MYRKSSDFVYTLPFQLRLHCTNGFVMRISILFMSKTVVPFGVLLQIPHILSNLYKNTKNIAGFGEMDMNVVDETT